jgi:hypothetical protein
MAWKIFAANLLAWLQIESIATNRGKRRELASTHFSSAFACWVGCSCRCFDFGLFQLVMF